MYMLGKPKKSFFERLTGAVNVDYRDGDNEGTEKKEEMRRMTVGSSPSLNPWSDEAPEEEESVGELAIDVYQTDNDIIIKAMVAGVRPEDLDISITRDSVTITGKREESRRVEQENYIHTELFWGAFSRTIALPEEVDIEEAEASEHHGLLVLKLPKVDKGKQARLRVKSTT